MARSPAFRRVLLFAGLALASSIWAAASAAEPARSLQLSPCHLDGLDQEVRCGVLEVAEDRAAAGAGRRLSIHVAVMPARRRDAEADPLFLLAGGPGQGAQTFAPLLEPFFREVLRRRDIVLVDQRGTGDSSPLACASPADELAGLAGGAILETDVAACRAKLDADVRFYASEPAMRDLDQVRAALGYERINLWGGSYGTRAALVYARLFPSRVRTVVLDGAAPFELRFPLSMAADSQRALDRLLAACAAEAACRAAYPRLSPDLDELLAHLAKRPARVSVRHPRTGIAQTVEIGRDAFAAGLRGGLYSPGQQSLLPLVIERATQGDFEPWATMQLATAAWSRDTMALGVTLSVLCTEDLSRVREAEIESASARSFLGTLEMEGWRQWCGAWPAGELDPRLLEAPPVAVPALVLSGDLDPVTPPRWGEVMARHFTPHRHLVVPGAGHNVSFSGCLPELIAEFIARGSADGLDAACVEAVRRPPFVLDSAGTAP